MRLNNLRRSRKKVAILEKRPHCFSSSLAVLGWHESFPSAEMSLTHLVELLISKTRLSGLGTTYLINSKHAAFHRRQGQEEPALGASGNIFKLIDLVTQ